MEIFFIFLALLLIVAALVGIVVPFLPGAPLAWVGIFVYAVATEFREISGVAVIWLGVMALLTMLIDILGPVLGVKGRQASRQAIVGSVLGAVFGIGLFGPVGIVLGPFLGALAGELIAGGTSDRAFRSAFGALMGFIFGSILKIAIVLAMAGYFVYALIF